MDLMSTQEFKMEGVKQLEPSTLDLRAGIGVKLKWGRVVNP